jgi:hypothetical protein
VTFLSGGAMMRMDEGVGEDVGISVRFN